MSYILTYILYEGYYNPITEVRDIKQRLELQEEENLQSKINVYKFGVTYQHEDIHPSRCETQCSRCEADGT